MTELFRITTKTSALAAIGLSFLALMMTAPCYADSVEALQPKLPFKIHGWLAAAQDQVFDKNTIFSYIDGGAEVYKAYNLQACLSRRYTAPWGADIILDIFDMGSSRDAFGVFTHDTDGEVLAVGQDARFRPGWLSFWKYRYFVSIYVEEESPAAAKAMMELAEQIAVAIPHQGPTPEILSRLPLEGVQDGSIRYLHHPLVLNYHYFLADENILEITPETDVVLAFYKINHQEARLLLVSYPEVNNAAQALAGFIKYYLPETDAAGTALLENGKWAAVRRKDTLVQIVLEADSRELAQRLLQSVR